MKRTAQAVWSGALKDGKGAISMQSGVFKDSPYSFKARFEDESGKSGTNPEELIAAAHASCFTMQLSHFLAEAGHPAAKLTTEAEVTIGPVEGGGQAISKSALTLRGNVPGMERGAVHRAGEQGEGRLPGVEGAWRDRDHAGCEAGELALPLAICEPRARASTDGRLRGLLSMSAIDSAVAEAPHPEQRPKGASVEGRAADAPADSPETMP